MMNLLLRPVVRMTVSLMSDHVRKAALDAPEGADAEPQEEGGDGHAEQEARQIDRAVAADDAPAEAVDDADHRIEVVEQPPLFRDDRAGETDRRDIEAELQREGDDKTEVAIFYDDCRSPDRRPEARQHDQQDEQGQQQDLP